MIRKPLFCRAGCHSPTSDTTYRGACTSLLNVTDLNGASLRDNLLEKSASCRSARAQGMGLPSQRLRLYFKVQRVGVLSFDRPKGYIH